MDWNKRTQPNQLEESPIDNRDLVYDDVKELIEDTVKGVTTQRPDRFPVPDQEQTPFCASYAMCSVINGYNMVEFKRVNKERSILDGYDFAMKYCLPRNACDRGRSRTSSMNQARNEGLIAGYAKLGTDASAIVKALKSGNYVAMESERTDWNEASKGFAIKSNLLPLNAHAYVGIDLVYHKGYESIKCVNSRGEEFGDKGYFYIRVSDIASVLRNSRVVFDNDDSGEFEKVLLRKKVNDIIKTTSIQRHNKAITNKQKILLQVVANVLRQGFDSDTDNPVALNKKELITLIETNL